jgi:glycosyltransferase involved in cell wall biosynthesis
LKNRASQSCILFLDHAPALGGAERSLLLVLRHLDNDRMPAHLACSGGPLAEHAAAQSVPIHLVSMGPLRRRVGGPMEWLAGARSIASLARQIGASLLVANTVRAAFYAAPAARLAHVPFVWYMRDFWLSEFRPRHLWADRLGKRLLCAAAARVLVNSNTTSDHLPCETKIIVIHNGIDIDRFDLTLGRTPFLNQHGIPADAPLVGTVGRLRPWKGQDRFLRSMARVADALPSARFLVVGGAIFDVQDSYPERLRRLAAELGIADRVTFTGQLADVRSAFAAMDVFVHPGDPEPFGLVNLEAMAMGKPVVAFAHGALPEIVRDGETGLLVPPGNEEALSGAVIDLLGDPHRRSAMGIAGRARVEAHFTAQRTADEVGSALGAVLGRDQGA